MIFGFHCDNRWICEAIGSFQAVNNVLDSVNSICYQRAQKTDAVHNPFMETDILTGLAMRRFFSFKKNRDWAENLQIVTQLGLTMAGCIVFCFFIGYYLDKWIGVKGPFITIFIILGIIGGGIVVFRQVLEITESAKKDENSGPDGNNSAN